MMFRTTTYTKAEALRLLELEALRIKTWFGGSGAQQGALAALQAGDVSANFVKAIIERTKSALDEWASKKATPGLAAYARDQRSDVGYDIVAEFVVMENAVKAVRDAAIAIMPTDGSGRLSYEIMNAAGEVSTVRLSPTETSDLQTAVQALLDAID
jgi:hypothetical protein